MKQQALIELAAVNKQWDLGENNVKPVLVGIDLKIEAGQFLAILGASGSGKSTLLRIIAGLTAATSGQTTYLGRLYKGINPGVAMVFQSFALFPWLTVLENVMMGLEAKPLSALEKKEKAISIIDLIGLDGFESAYPKELSGGMQQRVGLGRALVSEPDVLLMDEPFSALDVLTAENLRRDILELWREKKIPTQTIIMVTHGIEEAVYMADRILVVSGSPATIATDIAISLPHWRDKNDPAFIEIVDKLYSLMTNREMPDGQRKLPHEESAAIQLPNVSAGALTGFLELLEDLNEKTDLYKLADRFMMDSEDFFPVIEAAALLKLAKITDGDIELTPEGAQFAQATVLERKILLQKQLLQAVPSLGRMIAVLNSKANKRMNVEFFEETLARSLSAEQVENYLDTLIDWGRYAELFAYDENSRQLYLE